MKYVTHTRGSTAAPGGKAPVKFADVATEFAWDADVVALRTSVVEQYLQEETLCTTPRPLRPVFTESSLN